MATIPNGQKILTSAPEVNTTYGGPASLQALNTWYTMEDVSNTIRPYKVFTALLTQSGGGDGLFIGSGDLTIGVTYLIDVSNGGDWTNVGAPNNNVNTSFIATGTTPNSWGDGGNLIYNTGAPVVKVLENTIGNVWFVYLDLGNYACYCSTPLFTVNKTTLNSEIFYSNTNDQMCSLISSTGDFDSQSVVFSSVRSSGSIQFENNALQDTFFEIRVYN
jgi:hypothetical protein